VNDQGPAAPETLQHAHLDADEVGMEYADQVLLRVRRVGERAEDVEYGLDAQLAPHWCRMLHRAMVIGREHESDAGLRNARGNLLGLQREVHAERLQQIGAARFAGDRAVAVLRDARPAAAHTKVEAVEILKVWAPSPPVPTMSTRPSASFTATLVANSRMTSAAAAISPMVSFLTRNPIMIAAIIVGDTSPLMMLRIRESISSRKISRCSMTRASASCGFMISWPRESS
jgi:hypothetical protein